VITWGLEVSSMSIHLWTLLAVKDYGGAEHYIWRWCIRCGDLKLEKPKVTYYFTPGPHQRVALTSPTNKQATEETPCRPRKR